MADLAKQKKIIMPFFDRASQCEQVAPLVAYYTRFAGMLKGLALKPLHPDIEGILLAMMSKLEADKARLGIPGESDTEGKAQSEATLRDFALTVFAMADRTDQLGARDARLLNKYMSARTFLQALEAIGGGSLDEKEAELLKFCGVRCFQISRALKAGEPVPPPPQPAAESDIDLDKELAAFEDREGSGGGGGEALPSPPVTTPMPPPLAATAASPSSLGATAESGPMAQGLAPIFQPGVAVMYKKFSDQPPLHGRIIKASGRGALITTETHTAHAEPDELAPLLLPGAEVVLRADMVTGGTPGAVVGATIVRDSSDFEWPPKYSVRLPSAETVMLSHSAFVAVAQPRSGGSSGEDGGSVQHSARSPFPTSPAGSMPSVAATLPGVPRQNFGLAGSGTASTAPPQPRPPPTPVPPARASQPPMPMAEATAASGLSIQPARAPTAYPPSSALGHLPSTRADPSAAGSHSRPAAAAVHTTATAPIPFEVKETAKKMAKQAISALNFDDTQSAVACLNRALAALEGR